LRVPIAMPEVYEQNLWIAQNFPLTYPDLHHGLLGQRELLTKKGRSYLAQQG
jgi:hypothetical protein